MVSKKSGALQAGIEQSAKALVLSLSFVFALLQGSAAQGSAAQGPTAARTNTSTAAAVPAGAAAGTASPSISLSSPLDYQVFQRRTRLAGSVAIRGRATSPLDKVEARITGASPTGPLSGKWQPISLDQASGEFHAELPVAAGGFYLLEVRGMSAGRLLAAISVPHIGVGEVFVVSGQSNSTNYGEVPQATQTGMVSSFSGTAWGLANDPQPGVQDNSKKGSFIPAFGDALYRKYRVPIGIASVGHGSTSVRQWLPVGEPILKMPTMTKFVLRKADGTLASDGTLFNGMMERIDQFGPRGFRALLWHQGESDADQPPEHQIPAADYQRMMEYLIRATRRHAGWDIPWFVAQASYHPPTELVSPPLRAAQRALWQSGLALQGPDTDTLKSAYRQNGGKGVHMNAEGLQAHGALWAARVEAYLDHVLR